jgi:hypothetical protein
MEAEKEKVEKVRRFRIQKNLDLRKLIYWREISDMKIDA